MMLPLSITTEYAARLRAQGVVALYLFGSRALGTASEHSDYDYAVLLQETGHARGEPLYFALYNLLAEISPRTLDNDVIDIVFLRDAPLELRFHVVQHGRVLFDDDALNRVRFEELTVRLYCDYRPILDEFDRTILGSL